MMKRFLLAGVSLLSLGYGAEAAQQTLNGTVSPPQFMGLGMPAAVATQLSAIVNGTLSGSDRNFSQLFGTLPDLPTAYLGFVATGTGIPLQSNSSFTATMGKNMHIAADDLSAIALAYPCGKYVAAATGEEGYVGGATPGSNCTFHVAIADDLGNVTFPTWGGTPVNGGPDNQNGYTTGGSAATGSIVDGSHGWTDLTPLPVTIKRGHRFWDCPYMTNPSGIMLKSGGINVDEGEAFQYGSSALADITAACASPMASTGTVGPISGNKLMPMAIVAFTKRPSAVIHGDSIPMGLYDQYSPGSADLGSIARSLGSFLVGYSNMALGSDRSDWYIQSHTNRSAMDVYASTDIYQLGINGITGGRTAAAEHTDSLTILGYAPASTHKWLVTVGPYASYLQKTITSLTSTGNIATLLTADTAGVKPNGLITIQNSGTTGYNADCAVLGIVPNTSITCALPTTPAASPSAGSPTWTDGGQNPNNQTVNGNNGVNASLNQLRRAAPAVGQAFGVLEGGNALTTGVDSGRFKTGVTDVPTPNNRLDFDLLHPNPSGYRYIQNSGVISAKTLYPY